jgi:hypothetical protein
VLRRLDEFDATNRALRQLLAGVQSTQGAAVSAGQQLQQMRDEALKRVGELEAANRRLQGDLGGRELECSQLAGKVAHTERLAQSFEELKARLEKCLL